MQPFGNVMNDIDKQLVEQFVHFCHYLYKFRTWDENPRTELKTLIDYCGNGVDNGGNRKKYVQVTHRHRLTGYG